MNKITASDWVGIRMVYLLLAYDPSSASHPEVQRVMRFYEDKCGISRHTDWPRIFDKLRQDNGWRNTFTETGSALNRRLASSVTINYQTNKRWVGLTKDERSELWGLTDMEGMPEHDYGKAVEALLRKKNI
jgi:hypothetical protein